ncbi:hypothetical protein JR316_0000847 [Psilocybe cubensis]|uniref:Alginate lyase domain-containing protein n=2 Tax=Psilocybe cubensis TaxID=181762 RepID=A0A8H7YAQ3_PSICU|nr:hypothetical protein JR316_0000847 [Psilocybe cubensis]KAH9486782.1 hypothetical protein JR316_0000847 [Psilocybe cubensis]
MLLRHSRLSGSVIHGIFIILAATCALGDPNDWVNIDYIISQSSADSSSALVSSTKEAQAGIIRSATDLASKGPWSVVDSSQIPLPPSQNPHDYLSWAPYHWPQCNWCSATGRTHLVHTGDSSKNDSKSNTSETGPVEGEDYNESKFSQFFVHNYGSNGSIISLTSISAIQTAGDRGSTFLHTTTAITEAAASPKPTSTVVLDSPMSSSNPPSTSNSKSAGLAQAAAKTTESSCTASPTRALAPSATWTTCSYISKDGFVNPDTRMLKGPDAINAVSQAALYNAVAYALQMTSKYSKNVATFVDTFFLNTSTKVNPNVDFGQIVRGPGESGRTGTFTGILDLRGLVKIVNSVSILKALDSPDWSKDRDNKLISWFSTYITWLSTSGIGQKAGTRPNNHATFYTSQLAAAKFYTGDRAGAITDLKRFCSTTFLDQVAKNGEQPFEAVRSRPFHYRCFNLEALITNAKLGDQMGIDLWSCKSRYGATIQTALDFLMTTDPGEEDKSQLNPHVATISSVYGDPTGKYMSFLKDNEPNYQRKAYWFYDQTAAFSVAPASRKKARSIIWKKEVPLLLSSIPASGVNVTFVCPAVFQDAAAVEIEDDVFVTCDQLRPFYEDGI